MKFVERVIGMFNKDKNENKNNSVEDFKTEQKVENKKYEFRRYDLEYFENCKNRLDKYKEFCSNKNNLSFDNIGTINTTEENNSTDFKYIFNDSNNSCVDNINDKIEEYFNKDTNSKEEKLVNATNTIFNMNRTDSPFSVEGYTPEKQNEEFFYDFDNKAKLGIDTDADRYLGKIISKQDDWD